MSLLTQTWDLLQYQLHKATYDPDAEQFAKDKAAAAKKAAEAAATKKTEEEDLAQAKAEEAATKVTDVSGATCFGTPIKLSPANFFDTDTFQKYYEKIIKDGGPTFKGYLFKTLEEAKAKCRTTPNCTGIWTFSEDNSPVFIVYTSDPTLVNTVKKGSGADMFAARPDSEFIPLVPCVMPDDVDDAFSWSRLLTRVLSISFKIVMVFLLFAAALYGSSLATNLNLYREAPIRVLYAIYGFLFFWIAIPYSLLYRWWWKGKKPVFYALIPLVPYKFNNRYAAMLLSWMSFKPDDQIACLMEWKH